MVQERIACEVICSLSLPPENFFLRYCRTAHWNKKINCQPGCIEKKKLFLQRKKLVLSHTNKMSYFWIEKPISSPTHFLSLNFYEFENCSELFLGS